MPASKKAITGIRAEMVQRAKEVLYEEGAMEANALWAAMGLAGDEEATQEWLDSEAPKEVLPHAGRLYLDLLEEDSGVFRPWPGKRAGFQLTGATKGQMTKARKAAEKS